MASPLPTLLVLARLPGGGAPRCLHGVGHGAAAGEQYLELAASDSPADAARALHVALTVDEVLWDPGGKEGRRESSRSRKDLGWS